MKISNKNLSIDIVFSEYNNRNDYLLYKNNRIKINYSDPSYIEFMDNRVSAIRETKSNYMNQILNSFNNIKNYVDIGEALIGLKEINISNKRNENILGSYGVNSITLYEPLTYNTTLNLNETYKITGESELQDKEFSRKHAQLVFDNIFLHELAHQVQINKYGLRENKPKMIEPLATLANMRYLNDYIINEKDNFLIGIAQARFDSEFAYFKSGRQDK